MHAFFSNLSLFALNFFSFATNILAKQTTRQQLDTYGVLNKSVIVVEVVLTAAYFQQTGIERHSVQSSLPGPFL